MFKFIHAADVHIDSPLYGLERYEGAPAEEIRGATRKAFKNLISLALEEEVAFILIAGDLYDGDWKDYNTALFMSGEFRRLNDAGISVFIISGNHDAASQITKSLRLPPNVTLFSTRKPQTVLLEKLSVAIHGQGFAQRAVNEDIAQSYPLAIKEMINIGVLHTSLTGREGHDPYAPTTTDILRSKGYDYWALGHIHKREVVQTAPWVVFPGNLQGRHIGEEGAKGCTLATVSDTNEISVEHRNLDILRWWNCAVDASGLATPEEVINQVSGHIEEHLRQNDERMLAVRVLIYGTCEAHRDLYNTAEHWINEIRSEMNSIHGGAVWLEKIKIGTTFPLDLEIIAKDKTPMGDLVRFLTSSSTNPELEEVLRQECRTVIGKIPHSLAKDIPALSLSPESIRTITAEAKQLLLAQLVATGESHENQPA